MYRSFCSSLLSHKCFSCKCFLVLPYFAVYLLSLGLSNAFYSNSSSIFWRKPCRRPCITYGHATVSLILSALQANKSPSKFYPLLKAIWCSLLACGSYHSSTRVLFFGVPVRPSKRPWRCQELRSRFISSCQPVPLLWRCPFPWPGPRGSTSIYFNKDQYCVSGSDMDLIDVTDIADMCILPFV